MSLFNKDKKPTLKKKAGNNSDKAKLSKFLPTTLFVGIQEDVNEKALISYITSLAQSAFSNVREAKYSVKRLSKNRYIYEIHNGSESLTYLPLVISKIIEGADKEVILKTNSQNIRVSKKTSTRIETNTLIESNNREDDALVDYESKGKLKHLIKAGTEVFVVSSIAACITGVLAGVSFVTKYYMLNEDYSFTPKVEEHMTAHDYLLTVKNEHSQTRYIENIRFKKGEWETTFKDIDPPEPIEPINVQETEEIVNENVNNEAPAEEYNAFEDNSITPLSMDELKEKAKAAQNVSIDEGKETNIESPITEETPVVENAPLNMEDISRQAEEATVETDEIAEDEFEVKETPVSANEENDIEANLINNNVEEQNIDVKEIAIVEDKDMMISNESNEDEFEIVDAADIKSLDLSNLPDNIVLE